MTLADQYAKALSDVVAKNPSRTGEYLQNLRAAMKRRGHEKLLPSVLSACERLAGAEERRQHMHIDTPEARRTRILVELYKKLIA